MSMKYNISPKYSSLEEVILDIKKNFRSTGESIKSGRNHLKIIDLDNKRFMVKSFQRPTAIKSYTYGNIFPSKAKRSYDYANILLSKGIHTPEPVAYIDHYKGLQFLDRQCEPRRNLKDLWLNSEQFTSINCILD